MAVLFGPFQYGRWHGDGSDIDLDAPPPRRDPERERGIYDRGFRDGLNYTPPPDYRQTVGPAIVTILQEKGFEDVSWDGRYIKAYGGQHEISSFDAEWYRQNNRIKDLADKAFKWLDEYRVGYKKRVKYGQELMAKLTEAGYTNVSLEVSKPVEGKVQLVRKGQWRVNYYGSPRDLPIRVDMTYEQVRFWTEQGIRWAQLEYPPIIQVGQRSEKRFATLSEIPIEDVPYYVGCYVEPTWHFYSQIDLQFDEYDMSGSDEGEDLHQQTIAWIKAVRTAYPDIHVVITRINPKGTPGQMFDHVNDLYQAGADLFLEEWRLPDVITKKQTQPEDLFPDLAAPTDKVRREINHIFCGRIGQTM